VSGFGGSERSSGLARIARQPDREQPERQKSGPEKEPTKAEIEKMSDAG